jgi:hypothetical protein
MSQTITSSDVAPDETDLAQWEQFQDASEVIHWYQYSDCGEDDEISIVAKPRRRSDGMGAR